MHHYGNNWFFSKEPLKNKEVKTSYSTLQVFMTRKGKVGLRYSAAKKKLPELKEEIFPTEQEPIICQAFPWNPQRGAFCSLQAYLTLSGVLDMVQQPGLFTDGIQTDLPCTRAESRQWR